MKNRGFSNFEFLTVCLVCLVLSWILFSMVIQSQEKERYRVFLYDAQVLRVNAIRYQTLEDRETVYMKELVEDGFLTMMKNPFGGEDYCDVFESKVLFEKEAKKVSLLCGSYLIKSQSLEDNIFIYQVSPWKEKKEGEGEVSKTFYNYEVDGTKQYQQFLERDLFLKLFNQSHNTTYKTVLEIPSSYKLVRKKLYRSEKLVKKLQY